jgi:iron complex transport system ATP-binding protein
MKTAVEAKNIKVGYDGDEVLKDVSLRIMERDFISILGPNGSGKTTLIKALLGLIRTQCGEVWMFGRRVSSFKRRELAMKVSFLPQNPPVSLPFLVRDIVMMGRFPYLGRFEMEQSGDMDAARRAMRIMGIEHLSKRHLMELSGGEVKRVFIAQAIAQESDILFLDEPTASLDINYQVEIFKMLKKFNEEMNKTVVLVTHDINHAARYAKRIVLLKDGAIACTGSAEEVINGDELSRVFNLEIVIERDRNNKPFILV